MTKKLDAIQDTSSVQTRLKIYEEQGILEDSIISLRSNLDLPLLGIEDDLMESSPVDDRNIGVVTHSRWYLSLNETEERNLIRAIALELQRLELPLTLIEQYLEALVYGKGKHKLYDSAIPLYYSYFTSLLEDSFPAYHRVGDKKWLSFHFKHIFNLLFRGRIPNSKKKIWDVINKVILRKKPQRQVRALRNMKAKELAMKEKKILEEWVPEKSISKKVRETDAQLVVEEYEGDGSRDIQLAQNIRKHREREKKRIARLRNKK